MSAPAFLFKQTVSVQLYAGESAYGPQYQNAFTLRCRIEPRRDLIRDRAGNEVVSRGRLFCQPRDDLVVGSLVQWEGATYTMESIAPQTGWTGRTHHQEVQLL